MVVNTEGIRVGIARVGFMSIHVSSVTGSRGRAFFGKISIAVIGEDLYVPHAFHPSQGIAPHFLFFLFFAALLLLCS